MNKGLTPPLKWHGGKHYLAKRIVAIAARMPHLHFVEPFFGGGSVLLAKDPEGISEVVNDLNGPLTNFWRVLACPLSFEEFRRRAEGIPFCEAFFQQSLERVGKPCEAPGTICISCALAFFVCCRQSLAGRMKSFTGVTKTRTRRGMNNEVSAWLSAVGGLPAVHERLERVLILNRPALDVIAGQDSKDTLFYCDPPYLHETRATTGEYAHEMSELDHHNLLMALRSIKGRFLLSGYRSKLYDMVAGSQRWVRHDFEISNHAAGGKEKRRMTECLWLNYKEEYP